MALAVVLAFAMVRPHGWPEAVVAVPAAALLIASAWSPWHEAADEVEPAAAGRRLSRRGAGAGAAVRRRGPVPRRRGGDGADRASAHQSDCWARCSSSRAATTAILSLDATVVLLTPVVLATARTLRVPARPHAYATAHLANTASLLLPVSNLTNLLAFTAAGLSFLHFTAVMALPWLAAVAVEFLLLRWLFARDLAVAPTRTSRPRRRADAGVRARRAGADAGRVRGDVAVRVVARRGPRWPARSCSACAAWPGATAPSPASSRRPTCRSWPSCCAWAWWSTR